MISQASAPASHPTCETPLADTPIPGPSAIEGEGRAALDRRLLRNHPSPVTVALSGGSDSLALLRIAAGWADKAGRPLLALAVDHRLNPASASWTAFAAARAAESGAAFRALAWEGEKPAAGLPAAARAARHALLATAARDAGACVVLLGHTADDVAETEIMRARDAPGIGRLREWAPSPAWPGGDGVFLLRPMLGLRRAALRAWLSARGETWIEDPANDDVRYARVRARQAGGGLGASSPHHEEAVRALAASVLLQPGGVFALPLKALLSADPPAARRVLSVALLCAGGGVRPPRRDALDRLLSNIADRGAISTLCGARVVSDGEEVRIAAEPGEAKRRVLPPADPAASLRRLRAATFQIADEGALRTTSST